MNLTVCYYHVTHAFLSESTLYMYLNVIAWNMRKMWGLCDSNWTWTHNHLVIKRMLNHLVKLAKWWSCVMSICMVHLTACHYHNRFAFPSKSTLCIYSSKEFLDIEATIECKVTPKRVSDMIRTYSQMHFTDKYSQHSSIIRPDWLNGWVFIHKLSGGGFESLTIT